MQNSYDMISEWITNDYQNTFCKKQTLHRIVDFVQEVLVCVWPSLLSRWELRGKSNAILMTAHMNIFPAVIFFKITFKRYFSRFFQQFQSSLASNALSPPHMNRMNLRHIFKVTHFSCTGSSIAYPCIQCSGDNFDPQDIWDLGMG